MGWPDVDYPIAFLSGLPTVGDIPDSGVYKPIPFVPPQSFASTFTEIVHSNELYVQEVCRRITRHAADPAARDDLSLLENPC